ncbi:MAG: UDP-4-amino-4,6-dideoxy-N-acetyl-beta-L-altrosamine transaminase [Patescibacteria group bacterium]|nr:UDP-4-amino-4,6-dideoxy-N-acetyl-beta-L-altrosamine transaminase [Patescibacteria group bacterium]
MIQYGKQSIDKNDINVILKTLKSDWLAQGPKVFEFEKALAKYCGAKYAIAVCNGTTALHLAYLTAGFKKNNEIITTPNTFVATSNMLLACGAKPIFCDIKLDNYNIDENKIEKLITKKTKAIVPVHFAGQPCEMEKINKIAKKYKLLVIEDACHALGAKYKNNKIGNCKYSDMAVFSFHPVKPITTGEGGAILTNNKKYYDKLILLRNHGIYKDKNGKNIMTELGYNYRLTDIQSSLGISQLKKLNNFIKKRRQIIKWYKNELRNVEEIILPAELSNNYSGWHLHVIRTKNSKTRDKLSTYLKNKKIGINFHYPAVYSHPYYKKIGYKIKLKKMEEYHNSCITLPCHTLLKRKNIKYICDVIKKFLIINKK